MVKGQEAEPNPAIKMVDVQTHFSTKIVEAGIKKLMVCGKVMMVLDTESNIHIFDVVRKENGQKKEI